LRLRELGGLAMNILALITDGFGGDGGIARYNRDLLAALSASGDVHKVVAIPRHSPGASEPLPPKVIQTQAIGGRRAYAMAALRTARQEGAFDVIFCGHLYMAPLAALLSTSLRMRLWLQLHGIEAWRAPGTLVRRSIAGASLVTSVSRFTRHRFLAWADVPRETVRVLPNTFDAAFTPGERPQGLARRLDVEGRKVILTVSRLDERERYKGHDRVLAALARALASHPDAVFVIVGDGGDRQRLADMAQELGLAAHVRFVGHVPGDELADYYRLADLFVMPSTGEGFGIVFLEAAAAGLPVIGGNCDGSVDALADGAIGTVVNPLRIEEIAEAIVAGLGRGRMTAPGALARFSRSNFAAHVSALVKPLAA